MCFAAKINDTVNFGEEEEDDVIIEFDEVSGEEDIENVSSNFLLISCHSAACNLQQFFEE